MIDSRNLRSVIFFALSDAGLFYCSIEAIQMKGLAWATVLANVAGLETADI